jgi:hypothetical protein
MRIGRGSGKWNMMMEELQESINRDFTIFRTNTICEMNAIIEEFGEFYEILDIVLHIRKDYIEAGIIYNH